MRSHDVPPAVDPVESRRLFATHRRLMLAMCLIGVTGCDFDVCTKPLSAGLGDTIVYVGNGGHETWLEYRSERVGYKFTSLSFLYLDLWTWDGTFCVYDRYEKKYHPISAGRAAELLNRRRSDLRPPHWYRYPLGWFIFGPLFLLAGVGGAIRRWKTSNHTRDDNPPESALL